MVFKIILLWCVLFISSLSHGSELTPVSGTGFCINEKGYYASAGHLAHSSLVSMRINSTQDTLTLVALDLINDVSIWKAESPCVPLELDKVNVIGTPVAVLGFPLPTLLGETIKLTRGHNFGHNSKSILLNVAVGGGNSGSPVIGVDGKVEGIVIARAINMPTIALSCDIEHVIKLAKTTNVVLYKPNFLSKTVSMLKSFERHLTTILGQHNSVVQFKGLVRDDSY